MSVRYPIRILLLETTGQPFLAYPSFQRSLLEFSDTVVPPVCMMLIGSSAFNISLPLLSQAAAERR